MRFRIRDCVLVLIVGGAVLAAGGCSSRSEAQKRYLISESDSLGRCELGKGGDHGAPFDPLAVSSWDRMNRANSLWAQVLAWQIASLPKDPPADYTVQVKASLQFLRDDRKLLRSTVSAHEQWAKDIDAAIEKGFDVYVAVDPTGPTGLYVTSAFALDDNGRIAFLGDCANRASNSVASALDRAGADPEVVGPAIRRWLLDGDSTALVRAFGDR